MDKTGFSDPDEAALAAAQRQPPAPGSRVALMVTCLVDLFRPEIGLAAMRLLREAGFAPEAPQGQSCCGQPSWNGGDRAGATKLAKRHIALFEDYAAVAVPAGSCAATMIRHYPEILRDADDAAGGESWADRARALAAKSWELTSLLDAANWAPPRGQETPPAPQAVTYHDSCSGLRELGVKDAPRRLMLRKGGLRIEPMTDPAACCGFGGSFCVKYPELSVAIADRKLDDGLATNCPTVVMGDLGCLLHLEGRAKARKLPIRLHHIAEILAADPAKDGAG